MISLPQDIRRLLRCYISIISSYSSLFGNKIFAYNRIQFHESIKTLPCIQAYSLYHKVIFFAILPFLASCTELLKAPPHSSKSAVIEVTSLQVASIRIFKQKMERLQRVYYKLSIANIELCEKYVHGSIGAEFGTILHYQKKDRKAQALVYGITDAFSVRSIIHGGVADQAGLLVGDQIISFNGEIVVGENWINKTLLPSIRSGKLLSLNVRRSNGQISIKIQPISACSYPVELIYDTDITAITDGHKISITTGAMRFFISDDELAFAISHEMSHNLLGLIGSNQSYEYTSDYMAGYLLARAGYDVRHSANFFRRLAAEDPDSIPLDRQGPHPSSALRIVLLEDLHIEIKNKKQLNIPLVPNITQYKLNWSTLSQN
jgi:hypothetical protein